MNFRNSLYKDRDGEATGTAVFAGTRFTGFPARDWYGEKSDLLDGSPLNFRTNFMLKNDMVNLLRAGKEDMVFEEDGSVHINDIGMEEINDQLRDEGNGDLTIINTGPFNNVVSEKAGEDRETHLEYFDAMMDQGAKVVNPPRIAKACGDKRVTYSILEQQMDTGLEWYNLDKYLSGLGVEGLEADFEKFRDVYNFSESGGGDVPVVSKPANGSGGTEILFTTMETFIDRAKSRGSIEKVFEDGGYNPRGRVLQMSVPAEYDQRIIATEGLVETSEIRIGEGDLHNLEGGGRGLPVKRSQVQEGIQNLVEDCSEAFYSGIDVHENAASYIGWDALAFDVESPRLDGFPDYQRFLREHVVDERYAVVHDGRTLYAVPGESNDSPGSKIDKINSEYPEQNSALAMLKYADDMSRDFEHEPYDEQNLAPAYRKMVNEEFR